jgi:hypothetical protein
MKLFINIPVLKYSSQYMARMAAKKALSESCKYLREDLELKREMNAWREVWDSAINEPQPF